MQSLLASSKKKNYCNQWNNTCVIANKSYYLGVSVHDYSIRYMQGEDSICSPIEGLFFTYYFSREEWLDLGFVIGGYAFNIQNWEDYAMTTPSGVESPEPVYFKWNNRYVVPVLALEVEVHLIKSDRWSLKLNNAFTPIIWNHSLAIEYRFD